MLRLVIAGAAIGLGAVLLSSCATMSEDQCMAGDWGGQGLKDGAEGLLMSRLEDHAKACAKVGVVPDERAYFSAREDGLRRYCTVEGGFEFGRRGSEYRGVCPAELEESFLPAYRDGQIVYTAESALSTAESNVSSAEGRLSDRQDKLADKERELGQDGLTDAQREQIRNRIREVRDEIRDARRDLRSAENDLEYARSQAEDVRYRFRDIYGYW